MAAAAPPPYLPAGGARAHVVLVRGTSRKRQTGTVATHRSSAAAALALVLALGLLAAAAEGDPAGGAADGAEGQAEEDEDDIIAIQTELFEEKDVDRDGHLNPSEFRAMLLEDVHPDERMGEREVAEIFRHADADGDKKVSLQEWMANFFHGSPQLAQYQDGVEVGGGKGGTGAGGGVQGSDASERLVAREHFDKLDTDRDGYLSSAEILQMLQDTAAHRKRGDSAGSGGEEGVVGGDRGVVGGKEGLAGGEEGVHVGQVWGEEDEAELVRLSGQMVGDLDIDRDRRVSFFEFFGPTGIKDSLQEGAEGAESFVS